jgi:hypothetical protein
MIDAQPQAFRHVDARRDGYLKVVLAPNDRPSA